MLQEDPVLSLSPSTHHEQVVDMENTCPDDFSAQFNNSMEWENQHIAICNDMLDCTDERDDTDPDSISIPFPEYNNDESIASNTCESQPYCSFCNICKCGNCMCTYHDIHGVNSYNQSSSVSYPTQDNQVRMEIADVFAPPNAVNQQSTTTPSESHEESDSSDSSSVSTPPNRGRLNYKKQEKNYMIRIIKQSNPGHQLHWKEVAPIVLKKMEIKFPYCIRFDSELENFKLPRKTLLPSSITILRFDNPDFVKKHREFP